MFLPIKSSFVVLSAFLIALAYPLEASAQEAGKTRAQGRVIGGEKKKAAPVVIDDFIDYREDMRKFIQDIGDFGRRVNPNFVLLTLNGASLLSKRLDGNEDNRAPAEVYLRSIDGIIQESLFYGDPNVDSASLKVNSDAIEKHLDAARKRRIKIFTLDYATKNENISSAYKKARKKGYTGYVAPAKGIELNKIALFPKRPFKENPKSVTHIKDVNNFIFINESSAYGSPGEFAQKLHDNNFDMVVIEPFHSRNRPLSHANVNTIKHKKLGAKRLVLAYVNIGMGEAHRHFWKSSWKEGRPSWIKAPKAGVADKYFVEFWRPEWQRLMIKTPKSYIYGLIRDLGYDGVVLDGVEAYKYFEGDDE